MRIKINDLPTDGSLIHRKILRVGNVLGKVSLKQTSALLNIYFLIMPSSGVTRSAECKS